MRGLAAFVLIAAAACDRGAADCKPEAEALGTLLEATAAEPPSPLSVDKAIKLVERSELPRRELHTAPVVSVTATELRYQDEVVNAAALRDRLVTARERLTSELASGRIRAEWVPEPRQVYLAIDAMTPWTEVVRAVDAAIAADMTAIAFVFTTRQAITPPPRSAIDKRLDEIQRADPSTRAAELAGIIKEQIRNCPQVSEVFGRLAGEQADSKAHSLARSISAALVECRCRVNMAELRSTLFRVLYVDRPLRVVQLDPGKPQQPVELAAVTPWLEASKQLTSTTGNVRLIVR